MNKVVIAVVQDGCGRWAQFACRVHDLGQGEHAIFKQTDADVASFDGGFGSAYLARQVGQKRAREIFFLGASYSAQEAYDMGMVNAVVPHAELERTAFAWAKEIMTKSPTAIKMLKFGFNLIDDGLVANKCMPEKPPGLPRHGGGEGGTRLPREAPPRITFLQISLTMKLPAIPLTLALGVALCCPNQGLWAQNADTTAMRYTLEVLQVEARQPGLVRYEIHVLLPDSDRVSAVYGTDTHPLELRAPKGVFNSPYNGSWSSSGMNPKFLS